MHSDDNNSKPQGGTSDNNKNTTIADAMTTANACRGSLQIVPISLSNDATSSVTMVICDTVLTLSFVSKKIKNQLVFQGNAIKLNIAGINGTKEMHSERVSIKVTTTTLLDSVKFHVEPSMYLGH